MKEFYRTTPAKAIAFVLAVLVGAATLLCGGTAVYMYEQGYYQSASYYDTTAFFVNSSNFAYELIRLWRDYEEQGQDAADDLAQTYAETESNAAFVIADYTTGEVYVQNFEPVDGSREFSTVIETVNDDYAVKLSVRDPITVKDRYYDSYRAYQWLYPRRYLPATFAVVGLVLLVALTAVLLAGAGRRKGENGVFLRLQDRIPLDIYLIAAGYAMFLPLYLSYEMIAYSQNNAFEWALAVATVLAVGCIGLATLMTLAARFKAGAWWRNTILYRLARLGLRVLKVVGRMCGDLIRAIPLIWKACLAFVMAEVVNFMLLFSISNGYNYYLELMVFLFILFNLALFFVVGFAALSMQRLKKAGERLADGEFEYKADLKYMYLDFLEHAKHLNSIGDGMAIAVGQRMKSERLKTELITNVSHDIKTPLTSIVNYVDLLSREELTGRAGEYVEVLERQAGRLKKLTEDLVEASKASTGNLSVELARTDLGELIRQAVGEYEERLAGSGLEPVVTLPEREVFAMADGKYLWRVLDNLLSNVCKYSQRGTRVYIDLDRAGENAVIVIKNISCTRLNVNRDELMERFVRGDSARTTEGSGLGLHIARSLVELQRGTFAIHIDGDLFKATINLVEQ